METNEPTPILCGIDFSENAQQAATAAAILAARSGRTLLLVHVTDQFSGLRDDSPKRAAHLRSLEEKLQNEVERLKPFGASIETELLTGRVPENEIERLGQERGASLIVVSSVSKTAFARWTMGSVSEHLTQSSSAPTMVVRDAIPFEAWARGQRALKVFIGTDFTVSSEAALRWVANLRNFGPIEVIAGYVDWPPEEDARLDTSEELKLDEDPPMMQHLIKRDLREKVTQLLGDDHVSIRAIGTWGRPDLPLVEMAIQAHADLIVVGTHQRSGLSWLQHGSVSRGILRHAPMSVVCVPTSAMPAADEPSIRKCQRVLVAVDLNDPHDFVIPYAYSIIQNGTVRLVYNLKPLIPIPSGDVLLGGTYPELRPTHEHAQLLADITARLQKLAPSEAAEHGITTEVEITEKPDTAKAICAAAERFNADIICIGGHTRPGALAKALGSVSLAVLQSVRRPVLVVWPPVG